MANVLLSVAVVCVAPAAQAAPPPSMPVQGMYLNWAEHARACAAGGPQHDVIIVQRFWTVLGEHGCTLSAIRQRNPEAQVLVYLNIAGLRESPSNHPSTPTSCMTREEADVYEVLAGSSFYVHPRPDHSATTAAIADRERIVFENFTDIAAADILEPGYTATCASKLPDIAADGFDGVFLDDVNTSPAHGWGQHGSSDPTDPGDGIEYPTDAAYGDAMVGLVRHLAERAADLGLYTAGNVGLDPWVPAQRTLNRRMLAATDATGGRPLDAQFREFWMCWNDCEPVLVDGEWAWNAYLMQRAESLGRDVLTQSGRGAGGEAAAGIDAGAVEYSQASWWLMWDGQQSGSARGFWDNRRAVDPHLSPDIGTPIDPIPVVADEQPRNRYACLDDCRFMRQYTLGMVVVNASSWGPHTFELDESFRHPGTGEWVEEVTLGPGEGMTLLDY